jgi:hypothetical protein
VGSARVFDVRYPDVRVRLVGLGVVAVAVGTFVCAACSGSPASTPKASTPTTTTTKNGPPQADGVFPVKSFKAGWIETDGPRPGSTHCNWTRLSTPTLTIEGTIQQGEWHGEAPVLAYVDGRETAFATYGCAPWRNIDDYDPNAPMPQDALHSPMSNIDMPPGSAMSYNDEIKRTNSEIWMVNLPASDMVAWLRPRLSVGSVNPNLAMPWSCDDSDHTENGYTEWVWSDGNRFFRAQVDNQGPPDTPGLVEFQLGGGTWPC